MCGDTSSISSTSSKSRSCDMASVLKVGRTCAREQRAHESASCCVGARVCALRRGADVLYAENRTRAAMRPIPDAVSSSCVAVKSFL